MEQQIQKLFIDQWYAPKAWGWLLWPATKIFAAIVRIRKYFYKKNWLTSYKATVPVIIVGNITVGGTGKTPLVIHLAQLLSKNGYKPGIVSRGYKGKVKSVMLVSKHSDPKVVSDEAVLLANRSQCPVIIAKRRAVGIKQIVRHNKVNIIISDDGLQHYALERDIEIAVVDGTRRFGNGYSLPMGPLREPESRLDSVNLIVVNGGDTNSVREHSMKMVIKEVYSLSHPAKTVPISFFAGSKVHALAGIGCPERFFAQLRAQGIEVIEHSFPDHYEFSPASVCFSDQYPVLMTEKDAVKCRHFANAKHWVVAVSVDLPQSFDDNFLHMVEGVKNAR
jgi:tetraacyldisaccharide 4'-kinase